MNPLPLPRHYNPDKVGQVWKVDYQTLAQAASQWSPNHNIRPASEDRHRVCLVMVDVQNTFCIPGFELYVGGRSGNGAVDDSRRLCEFIYRNLNSITQIVPTMDTHQTIQIFHGIFLLNEKGEHPSPYTLIKEEDLLNGVWKFNPTIAESLGITPLYGDQHLLHYARSLKASGKYELTIWPYHAMLGGIGHALVSAVEEAVFFHAIARLTQPDVHIKGNAPLTEHYSVLGPEVARGPDGKLLVQKSDKFFKKLLEFDAVIIAGEAKSHCVAWSIADLLEDVMRDDKSLVKKIYLLEDCTSPVVVPGVVDYTDQANDAFRKFAEAGMHIVRSTDPLETWPRMSVFASA
ncbi:MAG: isochorismatase [Bacteroidota bacterium]